MGLFGKRRRFLDSPEIDTDDPATTVLSRDFRFDGEISTPKDALVAGQIDGHLEVGGRLHLVKGGLVKGTLTAGDAKLEGMVEGPVNVSGRLEVGQTARITGDIKAGRIAIAEGSFVKGGLSSGGTTHTFVEKRGPGE